VYSLPLRIQLAGCAAGIAAMHRRPHGSQQLAQLIRGACLHDRAGQCTCEQHCRVMAALAWCACAPAPRGLLGVRACRSLLGGQAPLVQCPRI
jgi:hypothetical protein